MKTYPQTTANNNVPKGAFLLAEQSAMSGEIVTTYYADKDGFLWKVDDWINSKPHPVFLFEACRLTGDTERMLAFRVEQHFAEVENA